MQSDQDAEATTINETGAREIDIDACVDLLEGFFDIGFRFRCVDGRQFLNAGYDQNSVLSL
jgi:hypothetical protein